MRRTTIENHRPAARLRRLACALATTFAVVGGLAADAQAKVYWTNFYGGNVGRAESDGSGVNQAFLPAATNSRGVAVSGSYVYWASGSQIRRAGLDGSGATTLLDVGGSLGGIAVDAGHLYWSQTGGQTIGRAELDGTGATPAFISGLSTVFMVAAAGGKLYWGDLSANAIGRANADGTGVDRTFITGAGRPNGVAADGSHVYWASLDNGSIGRANLDGTGVDTALVTGLSTPESVAVDGAYVYWAALNGNAVGRAGLAGEAPDRNFIAAGGPYGIAADAAPSVTTVTAPQTVSAVVAPDLSISVAPTLSLGTLVPSLDNPGNQNTASTAVTVTSTAANADISVADPSTDANRGKLVNTTIGPSGANEAYALANPLEAAGPSGVFAPLTSPVLVYSDPLSATNTAGAYSETTTVSFRQRINANEGLRSGTYAKALTFTAQTTTP